MKLFLKNIVIFVFIVNVSIMGAQTPEEYIKKARDLQKEGKLDQAIEVLSEAVKKHPDSAAACSYLGLFHGMKAGQTNDFMEAGRIIFKSFEMLDKGVSLEPDNPTTLFNRGVIAVNIPEFLGKLDMGIKDLESIIKIAQNSPRKVKKDMLVSSYNFLAQGYQRKKERQKAIQALEKIIKLSPGSNMAKRAEQNISKLKQLQQEQAKEAEQKKPDPAKITALKQKVQAEAGNPAHLINLGKAYIDEKNFASAHKVLKKAVELDSKNLEAYKLLITAAGELANAGYDEKIYENTDYRTNLAFEITRYLDKAVEIAPDDIEMRLSRGISGTQMPFFVNKLDQAIADLNWILKSKAASAVKADALYWLGMAYQKKSMSYWIKVVSDYSSSEAARSVFAGLRPPIKRLDLTKLKTPVLVIDFVLGFRDELAPQTAVWIENEDGAFIKTIYVSGFSGYAKEKQVNLPKWAKSSKFADVDAITGASIDLGHHIYTWDLKDNSGKEVKPGGYIVKVEVAFWPSMEYQTVSAAINVGKGKKQVVREEGNHIPYLELKYYPAVK